VGSRSRKERKKARFWSRYLAYISYPPALFCLGIGLVGFAVGVISISLLNAVEKEGKEWIQSEIGKVAEKAVEEMNEHVKKIVDFVKEEVLQDVLKAVRKLNRFVETGDKTMQKIADEIEEKEVKKIVHPPQFSHPFHRIS